MSTITPTSDTFALPNATSFKIGDLVRRIADGLAGRVIQDNYLGRPTDVFVLWTQGAPSAASVFDLSRQ